MQFVAGIAWTAYELAIFLIVFETISRNERTSLLTLYNLGNTAVIVPGSLLDALLLNVLGEVRITYLLLFALSSAVRATTLLLFVRVPAIQFEPIRPATRTLAIRPSTGALESPILSSLPNGHLAE